MSERFTLLAGTANPALATAIALELGVQTGGCVVDRFPDGEVAVRLLEPVRRKEVFLVQPTVLHKRRENGRETHVTHLVGDVAGRACLIVDDIIATAGTLAEAIRALLAAGARPEITIAVTHGLFLSGAREKLDQPAVREVWVTDTVAVPEKDWPRLRVASIATLVAGALRRFMTNGSLEDLS
jgi:phosphoribosylpyrophosphate synthetase